MRAQASLNVAQTLSERQLRESHAQELIAAREPTLAPIAAIPRDAGIEVASRQETHQLRKHEMTVEHKIALTGAAEKKRPGQGSSVFANSDRVHAWLNVT